MKTYLVTTSSVTQYLVEARDEDHAKELVVYHDKGKVLVDRNEIIVEEDEQ